LSIENGFRSASESSGGSNKIDSIENVKVPGCSVRKNPKAVQPINLTILRNALRLICKRGSQEISKYTIRVKSHDIENVEAMPEENAASIDVDVPQRYSAGIVGGEKILIIIIE
jgi:hypothetical protein